MPRMSANQLDWHTSVIVITSDFGDRGIRR